MTERTARSAGAPTRRAMVLGAAATPLLWAAGLWAAGAASTRAAAPEGRWRVASSANFNVYSAGDERQLRAYTLMLEDFDMTLRFMHGLSLDKAADRKLDVHLIDNKAELRVTYPDAHEDWAGYYVATSRDVVCVALRPRRVSSQDDDSNDITMHEYAHHFMRRNLTYAYAPWLVEGYAEYVATTLFKGDEIIVGKINANRGSWLMNAGWLPLEDLLTKRSGEIVSERRNNYYPQAWLLTHYFMGDKKRKAQLEAYIRAVGEGTGSVEAMEKATGMTLAELTLALRAYTKGDLPLQGFSRTRKREVPITVTRLPASADDLVLQRVRMAHDDFDKDGAAFVGEIRKVAERYPGDAYAELTLARAEQLAGDPEAGMAILDRRLAADPADLLALEYKALGLLAKAGKQPDDAAALNKAAGAVLAKAFQVDSNRYQILLAFARSRKTAPGYPSDNVMEALLLANELAPQVSEVTMETVQALAARREYGHAAFLLKPLVNDPHGRRSERAVQLLKELETKAAAGKSAA
ncbi:hypothetical protein [Caulobacter endophyticus]|uniref:hypothetical protein n=1 Tax=Caulobacter endophyticus TaxID=2172652 RepID=UPI0024108213|nr:hypothetical protein [Caulobacter endophyticus]MDG2529339.1 hypothetical protein [Caulobacter endophyticus]